MKVIKLLSGSVGVNVEVRDYDYDADLWLLRNCPSRLKMVKRDGEIQISL